MTGDEAAALSATLAWYDFAVAAPCAARAYNVVVLREKLSDGVSPERRQTITRGLFFIALFTGHLGVWRLYAAWCFKTGFWAAIDATPAWTVLGLVGILSALGVLEWGLTMAQPDSADGRLKARQAWWKAFWTGPLLGGVVMYL